MVSSIASQTEPMADDHAFGIRSAIVVESFVVAAGQLVDLVHVVLDDGRQGVVVRVAGFAGLEEDVRVLGRAAQGRVVRATGCAFAESLDGIHVDELGQILVILDFDLLDFVRGAEAVKEMQERDAAFDCGEMGDGCQVDNFLDDWRSRAWQNRSGGRP